MRDDVSRILRSVAGIEAGDGDKANSGELLDVYRCQLATKLGQRLGHSSWSLASENHDG